MNKHVFIFTLLACSIFSSATTAGNTAAVVPEPFKGFDANSKLVIDYTDLNSLFDTVVLNTGRSTREKADSSHARTGTRMKVKVNKATVMEGNRFFYEIFKGNEQNQQTLLNIRSRLESIPLAVPLERFSRDEQLAYWINLYNITVLGEVAKAYPNVDLEKMLRGKKSILSRKLLTVAGIPLSLDDIQFTILKQNYDSNPLVIYGLYQGHIGSPNIRKHAYTGKYVYADLIDNALEFVNSNRGTQGKNERVFRVSSLYERNQAFFEAFEVDLTAHLLEYLEGQQRRELQVATEIKTDINDWMVTDLYGSHREPAGSIANNSAALMGITQGTGSSKHTPSAAAASGYSLAVMERLNELNKKREEGRIGNVTVEELGTADSDTDTSAKVDGTR